jgi:hypothetical protein
MAVVRLRIGEAVEVGDREDSEGNGCTGEGDRQRLTHPYHRQVPRRSVPVISAPFTIAIIAAAEPAGRLQEPYHTLRVENSVGFEHRGEKMKNQAGRENGPTSYPALSPPVGDDLRDSAMAMPRPLAYGSGPCHAHCPRSS